MSRGAQREMQTSGTLGLGPTMFLHPASTPAPEKSEVQSPSCPLAHGLALVGRTQSHLDSWGHFSILCLFPCLLDVDLKCVFPQGSHSKTVSSATAFPPSLFFPDTTRTGESRAPPVNTLPTGPRGSRLTLTQKPAPSPATVWYSGTRNTLGLPSGDSAVSELKNAKSEWVLTSQ